MARRRRQQRRYPRHSPEYLRQKQIAQERANRLVMLGKQRRAEAKEMDLATCEVIEKHIERLAASRNRPQSKHMAGWGFMRSINDSAMTAESCT